MAALLASCDRRTVAGLRDFAILTVLRRLGLRAGEVAALGLDDVDWRRGEVVVRGKGGGQDRLPLPVDVGEAIVAYVRHRPRVACRALFLRCAPNRWLDVGRGAKTWSAARADVPGWRGRALTGCVITRPRPCWPAGRRCPRSARYSGIPAWPPRTCTPRWTGRRCALSPSRGREVPSERSAPGGGGLHRGPPGTGLQARAPRSLLEEFVAYLQAAGATTVTTELALAWATRPGKHQPGNLSNRLCAVRGFARHLQAFNPATEVPPARLLPWPKCRAVPYLYSDADIAALIEGRPFGHPSASHRHLRSADRDFERDRMRASEALRVDRDNVDWNKGVLTIRDSKFGKSRRVPLHPQRPRRAQGLRAAARRACPGPRTASFFVSSAGTRLVYVTVQKTFSRLVDDAGSLGPPSTGHACTT